MGNSIAPKSFPSPGPFGKSQINTASQVQTPDVAVNPAGPDQSQLLAGQNPVAPPVQPAQDPFGGAGIFDAQDEIERLRRIRESNSGRPMPFYG